MAGLQGAHCRLRAVEPRDVEEMYRWENDPEVWPVSGTLAPFSRHALEAFVESQQMDIFQSRQQRLMIEELSSGRTVGAIDLFEVEPLHRRAGVGILVHATEDRGCGFGSEALALLKEYARTTLNLHQLWCNIESHNEASRALFQNAGFELVGKKRGWNWSPEGWHDEELWQLILDEA
uniref:GNAT family N-acetyltransferase n=1 Tax=Alistipes sp. TaxID=1872444 RepID=UPI004056B113